LGKAFAPCLVVPVYEHHVALARILPRLLALGLPVLLVDDGSTPACAEALDALAAEHGPQLCLQHRAANGGKGAAVKDALRWAAELGYSHALQVDADGQHDLDRLPALLAESRALPEAVVCAQPQFAGDAPAARRRGRQLTNFWIAVNTLSRAIPDGMCGLRCYPLAATVPLLAPCGDRMDFDPELLVRLQWRGLALRFLPVAVSYPEGGISGFRLGLDNALISWMHTRLFFGMLLRSPLLLWRKLAGVGHGR
jgi:glycosyltransferase involved in cell wall biosynthesis